MLREINDGALVRRGRHWRFADGRRVLEPGWSRRALRAIGRAQLIDPVAIARDGRRRVWVFEDRFYAEDDGLDAPDVMALVRDRERRARTRLERAHARLAQDASAAGPPRRERIARETRRAVFERDGGRCVACDARFDIQYDHVIPVSMGGASTVANLQLLCADCNRRKGDSLG